MFANIFQIFKENNFNYSNVCVKFKTGLPAGIVQIFDVLTLPNLGKHCKLPPPLFTVTFIWVRERVPQKKIILITELSII